MLGYAATIIFYDHGYRAVRGVSNLDKLWRRRLTVAYTNGDDVDPLRAKHKGSTAYTDKLERQHPGYIHKLFRKAQRELGNQATFNELANKMNRQSRISNNDLPNELPNTKFNTSNLYRWFNLLGGKQKSPIEKPYLTPDQKKGRLDWCHAVKELIAASGNDFHACFLDEKWFYTTSRRRKVKILPAGPDEDPEEVVHQQPTTRSRRHAIKVMYLGVVGLPVPKEVFGGNKDFDGKIFLDRVSKVKGYKKATYNQNFTDVASNNGKIKCGKLVDLLEDNFTLLDLKEAVAEK